MAIGDLKYIVNSTGFGITEAGFDSDPNSNTLPTILSNAHPSDRVFQFEVELYVNNSIIDTESGANTVYSNTAVYDIDNVSISPTMIPGASRLANNVIEVRELAVIGNFLDEIFTFQTFNTIPSSNGTTIESTTYDTIQGANTVFSSKTITNTLGQSLTVNTSFMDTQIINSVTSTEFVPDGYFTEISNNSVGMLAAYNYTPDPDEVFTEHSQPAVTSYTYNISVDVTPQFGDTPISYDYDFTVEWDASKAFALIQSFTGN